MAARLAAAAAAAEPPPAPPPAGGPRGTLIVCPLSVLTNWQMQIQEHTRGGLQARPDAQRMLPRFPQLVGTKHVLPATLAPFAGEQGQCLGC